MSDAVAAAVIASAVPVLGGLFALLVQVGRKLGTLEAITTKELTHNHGSSMKDWARDAKADAAAARSAAELAKTRTGQLEDSVTRLSEQIADSRLQRERDTGSLEAKVAKVQHDVTNVRVGQGYLVHQLDRMDEQRLAREARWALKLQAQGLETPDPLPTDNARPLPDALTDVAL